MWNIGYKPAFLRALKKLPLDLREEAKLRIRECTADPFATNLRTHKLSGPLKHLWSFSVNYRYRIVFEIGEGENATLLMIGDHRVYGV